jgi:hypothetical protein
LGLALLIVIAMSYSSEQAEDKVQDNGKNNAYYDAGCYGKEELKVPLIYKYIAGESSQEGNSLPEEQ